MDMRCEDIMIEAIKTTRGDWTACSARVMEGPPALKNRTISISGVFPDIAEGKHYDVRCEETTHPRWGKQYKVVEATPTMPKGTAAIADYLSGTIKGIGVGRARHLVDAFGDDITAVLDAPDGTERLIKDGKLSEKLAHQVIEQWTAERTKHAVRLILQEAGIKPRRAAAVYTYFGAETAHIVQKTPYRLIEVPGIGFKTADGIALRVGIPADSPERQRAAAVHVAQQEENSGHCYTSLRQLVSEAGELIQQEPHAIINAIMQPQERAMLVVDQDDRAWTALMLHREEQTARRLQTIYRAASHIQRQLNDVNLDELFAEAEFPYTSQQRAAVKMAAREKVMILTGGAGVGKTTTLKAILRLYEKARVTSVRLCAPTGKAARRMEESTNVPASTIHRLMGGIKMYREDKDSGIRPPMVIIIDEASMVDIELMEGLLALVGDDTHIVFVGDVNQLPSVGPGKVLFDIIQAGFPTAMLTQVMRQAEQSEIIMTSHAINGGDMPSISNKGDMFFFEIDDTSRINNKIVELVAKGIPDKFGIHPLDIQVLAPQKSKTCGTDTLNRLLQDALNPKSPNKAERFWGDGVLRVGDRLVWTQNNYQLGLVNGEEVYVIDIRDEDRDEQGNALSTPITIVYLNQSAPHREHDEPFPDIRVRMAALTAKHAYAMSVHKSQGSEYPCSIFVVDREHQWMLTKRLIYTAVTRAKQVGILVGQRGTLWKGILNCREDERRTALAQRLSGALEPVAEGQWGTTEELTEELVGQ